jgi:hypothetical protein
MNMCVLVGTDRRKTVNIKAGQCPAPFTVAGDGDAVDRSTHDIVIDLPHILLHPALSTPYIRYTDFIESIIRSYNSEENSYEHKNI